MGQYSDILMDHFAAPRNSGALMRPMQPDMPAALAEGHFSFSTFG